MGRLPGAPWRLRMGLHTGLVVVGGMRNGDDAETAATIVGDVVSVATALEERAAPGRSCVAMPQHAWSRGRCASRPGDRSRSPGSQPL